MTVEHPSDVVERLYLAVHAILFAEVRGEIKILTLAPRDPMDPDRFKEMRRRVGLRDELISAHDAYVESRASHQEEAVNG